MVKLEAVYDTLPEIHVQCWFMFCWHGLVEIDEEEHQMEAHLTQVFLHMRLQLLPVVDFCRVSLTECIIAEKDTKYTTRNSKYPSSTRANMNKGASTPISVFFTGNFPNTSGQPTGVFYFSGKVRNPPMFSGAISMKHILPVTFQYLMKTSYTQK
ncbi:hypothetical protein MAR_001267 [Mya arenaria]|uniref:Uncharacterized protein n=1 Tax=Mya arenaria TaxID=6604 RepID=A0ABY7FEX7_MYAAR|nr:hypothetical protein MAR_001267 [Mya arenaria]